MLQMHKLSHYCVISFFLFCRDCPNAPIHSRWNENRTNPPLRPQNRTSPVLRLTTCLRKNSVLQLPLLSLVDTHTWLQASNISPCLNKWKFIYDYWGKAAWIIGSFRIHQNEEFYLISLRYWQRNKVCACCKSSSTTRLVACFMCLSSATI